ncbi:LLM class flavin-dependent oxidoreductase [Occultella kanbiaonis]|uniref:LLM class flavin-dependent oxidoreductase n=1 Tax=Occultella kanbiaonis TaxID=2675754 RepID=UPI0012B9529A|nr:LLM class flavin-dependent oxidoreductase [Occultella kanbiaonis]
MSHRVPRLGVALDNAGWHPAAWRRSGLEPGTLFSARYWVDQVSALERAGLDFVTFEDAFSGASPSAASTDPALGTDAVRGRLDALLLAARLSTVTSRIGLVPTATVTHTEPYHLATALATLDHASKGRAGWQVRVSPRHPEAQLTGRRTVPDVPLLDLDDSFVQGLFDEAAAVIETARALWDSWDDDAVIRDVATGRFLDADKLHHVDASSEWFTVAGPSIVPRPPQGQVLVTALAHGDVAYRLAALGADVVFVTPRDGEHVRDIIAEVRAAERAVGRIGTPLRIIADVEVVIDITSAAALLRLAELQGHRVRSSDATLVAGSADEVARLLESWAAAGVDGFRLRPAENLQDLPAITGLLVPELIRRDLFDPDGQVPLGPGWSGGSRAADGPVPLRARFGLDRPPNRYHDDLAPLATRRTLETTAAAR